MHSNHWFAQEEPEFRRVKTAQGITSTPTIQGFSDQSPLSTYISNFTKQQQLIGGGDDSSVAKTKYAQSSIPPYSEAKHRKEGAFMSSPDTGVQSPYDQV